jgi:hypothetical protein
MAICSVSARAFPALSYRHEDSVLSDIALLSDVLPEQGVGYQDNETIGKVRPNYDINSEAMACGREAFRAARSTQTADLHTATPLGFSIQHDFDNMNVSLWLENNALQGELITSPTKGGFNYIFHNGPAQIYLARAPGDDLTTFNGTEGKWFKIASITAAHDTHPNPDYWITYRQTMVSYILEHHS